MFELGNPILWQHINLFLFKMKESFTTLFLRCSKEKKFKGVPIKHLVTSFLHYLKYEPPHGKTQQST